jgi:hypothetical protein
MINSAGTITTTSAFSGNNFATFGEDVSGELYVAGITSGIIFKIQDASFGTLDYEINEFSLFPNPAKNSISIKLSNDNLATKIAIFDLTGKLLLSQKLENNPENTISIASLTKGIYMVSVETENGVSYSKKLMIE